MTSEAPPPLSVIPGAAPAAKARVIPGLVVPPSATKKQRSRAKKSAALAPQAEVSDQATTVPAPEEVNGVPELAAAEAAAVVGPGLGEDELIAEVKKTSATEATAKRLRAANKKLQRIEGYEAATSGLNADQQKAILSKPVVAAVIKELSELLDILKAEEAEDVARESRTAAIEEKQVERTVAAAVAEARATSQKDVVLLLQFLHLHGLISQGQTPSAFAPAPLPPAIANATGQEVAAVHALYDAFTNGPLLGGGGDAVEKIAALQTKSADEVIHGVSYARIGELILGMTAVAEPEESQPAQLAPEPETASAPLESAPAGPSDSVIALVDGTVDPSSHAPSFLQKSELEQPATVTPPVEEKVTSWAEDVETTAVPTPTVAPEVTETKAPEPETSSAPRAVWGTPAAAAAVAHVTEGTNGTSAPTPTDAAWGAGPTTTDWSAEDADGGLPSLEGLTTAAPSAAVVAAPAPINGAEGQTQGTAGTASRGRGRGGERGRGGPHRGGEYRGRGGRGGRGGARGGSHAPPAKDEDGWTSVPSSRPQQPMRGSFRVGSEGRGRGRGGPRGPSRAPSGVEGAQQAAQSTEGGKKW